MQDEYTISRVAERLRGIIQARGESLKSFSDKSGIPYRSLQEYVGGKNKPGFEQLQKMASVGVDVGFLLTGLQRGASLKHFTNGFERPNFLVSDEEFSGIVYDGLLAAIDRLNGKILAEAGRPMTAKEVTAYLSQALAMALRVTDEMQKNLIDLRAHGVSAQVAASIILEAVGKKLEAVAVGAR